MAWISLYALKTCHSFCKNSLFTCFDLPFKEICLVLNITDLHILVDHFPYTAKNILQLALNGFIFLFQVHLGYQNISVMTFGQPRIGNAAFVSYYRERVPNTIRVTNRHDIVPHLPPYYPYLPHKTYRHFPREASSANSKLCSACFELHKSSCKE